MRLRHRHLCVSLLLLGACATAAPEPTASPQRLAQLEAAAAQNRNDLDAQMRLGAGYLQAGRTPEAIALLEGVVALPTQPAGARYFLGLAYEAAGRFPDARRQYTTHLERAPASPLRQTVRGRIAMLERRELERAVQNALSQERALANSTPEARVVGVFPFLTEAGAALTPLGRALAELLTQDLSLTGRLTVVERAQVQRLLDEIQIGQRGSVDPASAARAGRMLGAGRIVQGRLDGTEAALRMQALVVPVPAGNVAAPPLNQQGALRELIAMQNNLALEVYRALGVELTVAERERVLNQPTQNVQALLAFGFGLEAEDAGRYAEAVVQYRRAAQLDPNFALANAAVARAEARSDAADDTPQALVSTGLRAYAPDLAETAIGLDRFGGVESLIPNPAARDPLAELLGTEGFERRSILQILIRRPQ